MANLRNVLYAWRDNEAAKKGVELFRVLANSAIDEIVRAMPKTKDELTAIKGIKDAKFAQYGQAILAMVAEHGGSAAPSKKRNSEEDDVLHRIDSQLPGVSYLKDERTIFSVSGYLDEVNRSLFRLRAPIKGEVTSFKFQGNAVYFSLRDKDDTSTLSVFMWTRDFELAGIELTEGLEVIVMGRSEIYKPSGRFNFRAETIELVGEGAWKKAYDELKKKLATEGLFLPERKRMLPEHPRKIGLITSRTGAVIHDFLNNLGKFGYQVTFVDARVEGASAVKDLLSAIKTLSTRELDALVLIRGGGSLESLQAFNNEHVVRALAEFPVPTICAIGHDKDVPLAQLAADIAPSTPTAVTTLLNASWEDLVHELAICARDLLVRADNLYYTSKDLIYSFSTRLEDCLTELARPLRTSMASFVEHQSQITARLASLHDRINFSWQFLGGSYSTALREITSEITISGKTLVQNDPMRQLKLGYSIITHKGVVLRNLENIAPGDRFEARVADGTLEAQLIGKKKI